MTDRSNRSRRRVLELSGSVLAGTFLLGRPGSASGHDGGKPTGTQGGDGSNAPGASGSSAPQPSLRKLGRLQPSSEPPHGGYSEAVIRPDGRYAVLGTKWGAQGTYLVDLSDPAAPRRVHHLPSSNDSPNMDVKVHYRDGIYFRTIERDDDPASFEIVDYGYRVGTPRNPQVVASVEGPDTHNVEPHPTAPVLYAVNYYDNKAGTDGFEVYDVRDPSRPRKVGAHGPAGYCHDITVDPTRDLLHCAYQGGGYTGYLFYDVSDPRKPVEVGRFDYGEWPDYPDVEIGQPGYDSAHHSDYDPRRELLYLGDERAYGPPGGKHVLDVGWRKGSIDDPIPVGYTLSPNAKEMESDPDGDGEEEFTERLDWTGHHFDVVPHGERTLLVSADWHDGFGLYDVTDPTDPHSIDRYATTDGASALEPTEDVADYGEPPMVWSAAYNPARGLIAVSDAFTGLYTFEITPGPSSDSRLSTPGSSPPIGLPPIPHR